MIRASKLSDVTSSVEKHTDLPSELTTEDIQEIMRLHNEPRRRYGLPELEWDESLAQLAKKWADTCYWGHWKSDRTRKALGADYFEKPRMAGENLSIWTDPSTTMLAGQYGTSLWTEEEPFYRCGEPISGTGAECSGGQCGHWTQMMWQDTKKVGCALRTCPEGVDPRSWNQDIGSSEAKYLVCQYDPPGNFTGETPFTADKCELPKKNKEKAPVGGMNRPPERRQTPRRDTVPAAKPRLPERFIPLQLPVLESTVLPIKSPPSVAAVASGSILGAAVLGALLGSLSALI